jgi:malonyl-CoA/methylmalonyl-CoA synthetase
VGRFDADGYLSIVGRSKDLIISGGYNVYPKEIEGFIDEMDGVLESAVIGVPHADFGEAVAAVIVLRDQAQLDEAQVLAYLKSRIANFKVPKRVHFVAELPRNTMGKVQKNLLRQQYA